MMENDGHLAARGKSRSRAENPPTTRSSCGTNAGANAHYAHKEWLCFGCSIARTEHNRLYNARERGTGEFSRIQKKWHLDEPFEEWRLLQVEQLEDGPYISGPWYTRIRVPRGQVNGDIEIGGLYAIKFHNGEATYRVHAEDDGFVLMDIVRSSIRSWLDIIEEKYQ